MPVPTPETAGALKTAVETLFKPFSLIFNPVAERIGHWLKRKPRLHIYVHPQFSAWCYAWDGEPNQNPMMQARFDADMTNDSNDESVLILDGWIEGTKPQIPFREPITVPPTSTVVGKLIAVFVRPVLVEGGEDFTRRVILLDQLKREHKTDEITFKWVGTTERPKPPAPPAPWSSPS